MRVALATSLQLDHGWRSLDPYPDERLHMQDFVPVGLLSLVAAVQRAELPVDIEVLELNGLINAGRLPNDLRFFDRMAEHLLDAGDALVGLMTDADSLHHTLALADAIKRRSPGTRVCLGGPGASPLATPLLERFPCIDLVVQGEAELSFVELLDALCQGRSLHGIPGMVWRDGDRVIDNGPRALVESLDDLPAPAFEAYDMAIGAPLYLDVGRGCPYKCTFCATAPYWERRFRMKSIERIVAEMALVRDRYGRSHVNFSHDVFTANQAWVHRFCARLAAALPGTTWTCSTRTDLVDAPLLDAMAAAGCVEIYYGIETGSQALQRVIDKNLDLARALDVVRATRAAGIRPVTGFIIGYPMETEDTLGETVERFFAFLEAGGFRAHLFALCPFAGAPMFARHGAHLDRPAEYLDLPLVPTVALPGEQRRQRFPDIFSSTYRYATPGVARALVDASEELSPHLVALKTIWPRLLPHYPSALDWYRRWTEWIAARNALVRPGALLAHQGDAHDLLDFIEEELARMGLADDLAHGDLAGGDLAELVRYERAKLDARHLAAAPPAPAAPIELGADTVVARRCEYLLAPFQRDLRALLRGAPEATEHAPGQRWVVFVRLADAFVRTMEIGPLGKSIIEALDAPRSVGELLSHLTSSQTAPEAPAMQQVIRQLVQQGLLTVEGTIS